MKQKPRELKRFVIADLGLVPKPSKHSWVMILWLLLIIIIVSVPKAVVRVGLKEITKLSRVWCIFLAKEYISVDIFQNLSCIFKISFSIKNRHCT